MSTQLLKETNTQPNPAAAYTTGGPPTACCVAAVLSIAAAGIHFAVTPDHFGEAASHGLFMLSAGLVQAAIAIALVARPRRPILWAAIAVNTTLIVVWALSRTVGLPFGIGVETVRVNDMICVGFEAGAALASMWAIVHPRTFVAGRSFLVVFAVALLAVAGTGVALAGTNAGSMHADAIAAANNGPASANNAMAGMDMGSGSNHDQMNMGSTGAACSNVSGAMTMSNGMIMAPVPQSPPTPSEQAAADKLVADSRAGTARYQSQPAATADGYKLVTSAKNPVQHWANYDITRRHDVLDPQHPDALIYATTVKGPELIGVMYLSGTKCQPGPDVGGTLTQWHAHADLCLDTNGNTAAQPDTNGNCSKGHPSHGSQFMLHVWLAPSLGNPLQPEITAAQYTPILRTGNL